MLLPSLLLFFLGLYAAAGIPAAGSTSLPRNAPAAPNVALHGASFQSTSSYFGASRNAIDGSLANNYLRAQCSYTNEDFAPWWMVDLKTTFRVMSVAITNRVLECCKERIYGAEIRIGNSKDNGGTLNPRCGTIASIESGETLSFSCSGMEGRYVTVTIPGRKEKLALCEVQVFGLPTYSSENVTDEAPAVLKTPIGAPNIAVKGISSQSSLYNNYGVSKNAIDGSLESNYLHIKCTHTAKDFEPWWMVDLTYTFKVFSVAVTNRGDCCKERINGAEIRIGNSTENGGMNNPRCGTIHSMDHGETLSFECDGMEGRYVTVGIPGRTEHLSICEVQVFGLPAEDASTYSPEYILPQRNYSGSGLKRKALIFPEETENSYVLLSPSKPMQLQAFTLCMNLATELPVHREIILFSYHTGEYDELNLWREKDGRLSLYLRSSEKGALFSLPKLSTFGNHLCVTWASYSGITAFWFDGQKSMRKVYRKGHRIQSGGIVMIGQDQDGFGGGFDIKQSFVGEIRDLYLWDYILSDQTILNIYKGVKIPKANILDWRTLSYEIQGQVIVQPRTDYYRKRSFNNQLVHYNLTNSSDFEKAGD
ncbi:pentraxin fusion protein-like [Rhinatrema bivittatum]|uniref:pentraxin fusion protein-like n=1 Tax=Rhinatrema bivittatum TaxID=194408 RepID=UPI00112CF0E5|nr:pentraxin fusion protein-like [Rhinatrema bivittatum]